MIAINFATRNFRRGALIMKGLLIGAVILALTAAAMLWTGVALRQDSAIMEKKLKDSVAADAEVKPVLAERAQLIKDLSAMSGLLESRRFSWTKFLTSIEAAVPTGVAMKRIDFNPQDGSLSLEGIAQSPEALRNLIVGLERSASFKDPLLKHQSQERGASHSMWWQSITAIKKQLWLAGIPRKLRAAALVFAGLVCLNLILYGFLVAPSRARLRAGEARYGELRQRHAEAVLFEKQKPSFTGVMSGVPSQKDMPLLVKDLVQTARSLKLSVAAVKYDMTKRTEGELAMVAFSFPAEGRYPEIKRFIYDVETTNRLVGIRDLKLETDQGRVKLDMKLVTYIKGNVIQ